MKNGIIWLTATLIFYALLLAFMGGYRLPSFIFHSLLLGFPLALVMVKRESRESVGLIKGEISVGLCIALVVVALSMAFYARQIPSFSLGIIISVIYSPAAEEMMLRGYLQPKCSQRWGQWVAIGFVAVLFTAIHLPKVFLTDLTPPVSLVTFLVLGLIFGYIREVSRSVYYPMLAHAGYNLAIVLIG